MVHNTFKDDDFTLWQTYQKSKSPQDKQFLLNRMDPLIQSQISKFKGVVPDEVLTNQAKVLASKALDTYNPDKGTALGTHVVNNIAPISRTIYTHQNTARLPENLTLKMRSYQNAEEELTSRLGREPTTDELQDELGWTGTEINRIKQYNRKDLVESAGEVSGDFFHSDDVDEDSELAAIFYSLTPNEKGLFEDLTGYNGARKLSTPEILEKHGLTQAQLSYKKTLLTRKIDNIRQGKYG